MIRWSELAEREPELAESATSLLYFVGVGLGFLATVRPDGGPRVHPICPLLDGEGLYGFIVPSPKRGDLLRDGRYALHSFPMPDDEDAAYLTGFARPVADSIRRARLAEQFASERSAVGVPPPDDSQQLFEFLVGMMMVTRTTGHGDPSPQHRRDRGRVARTARGRERAGRTSGEDLCGHEGQPSGPVGGVPKRRTARHDPRRPNGLADSLRDVQHRAPVPA